MLISEELENTLQRAVDRAKASRHEFVAPEHLLFALTTDEVAAEILYHCGADLDGLRSAIDAFLDNNMPAFPENVAGPDGEPPDPSYTLGCQLVLQLAASHVQSSGKEQIDGGNVLAALFRDEASHATYFLKKEGILRLDVVRYISHKISRVGARNLPSEGGEGTFDPDDRDGDEVRQTENPLEEFCTNLNRKAAEGRLDPLIGRKAELERTVHILARRRKNNPIFVGDAGVGKTAIVEGLALRIHQGDVPEYLKDVTIYALDMGGLLAGTRYRGDFEERLKSVIDAVRSDRDRRILFVDEIHSLIGAGAVSGGAMDASNMLKPALASGEIKCIGTTTYKEYRQVFEKDHALSRRFQKIDVPEPSADETIEILKGLQGRYEEFHGVAYAPSAIRACVELAAKHISDRFLPDKAIDVLDEAGAEVKLRNSRSAVEVAAEEAKTIRKSEVPAGGNASAAQATAAKGHDAISAVAGKDAEPAPRKHAKVTSRDMENVVSRIAKVPTRSVKVDDRKRLETLGRDLKFLIYGQDAAVDRVVSSIQLARAGLGEPDKPIGSFLFAGPTGVGKTELAKQLAAALDIGFLRFDMSEYMEKHAVSRLIGSPPGYVGFDQGGQLTEAVHRTPHAVLLLDEIEKAHSDIDSILLQIMDYATLTDNNGRKADFRNVILIMTTNTGAREGLANAIGFEQKANYSDKSDKAIEKAFAPEFRNRLTSVVQFRSLGSEIAEQIVEKMVAELENRLKARGVNLTLDPTARSWIAVKGYDAKFGARPMRRLIESEISHKLSHEILFGRLAKGGHVRIKAGEEGLVFEF